MKILGIDTSSKLCSVAIIEDNKLTKKIELDQGFTHSEILMPIIKEILEDCQITLSSIDLIVCDIGPGSFTGIRIGVATAKAFSDSLGIPTIGVSSLEVLARQIKQENVIVSTIDCKNENCYFAVYEYRNGSYEVLEKPQAQTNAFVLSLLQEKFPNAILVGDGLTKENPNNLDSYELCLAGLDHYKKQQESQELLPLYLKKPQAQKELEKKLAQNKAEN